MSHRIGRLGGLSLALCLAGAQACGTDSLRAKIAEEQDPTQNQPEDEASVTPTSEAAPAEGRPSGGASAEDEPAEPELPIGPGPGEDPGKLRCSFSFDGSCGDDAFVVDRHTFDAGYETGQCEEMGAFWGVTFCNVYWQERHDTGSWKCQLSRLEDCSDWRISILLNTYEQAEAESLCDEYYAALPNMVQSTCLAAYESTL